MNINEYKWYNCLTPSDTNILSQWCAAHLFRSGSTGSAWSQTLNDWPWRRAQSRPSSWAAWMKEVQILQWIPMESNWPILISISPPARWRLLDFITVVLLLRLLLLILHLLLLLLPLLQLLFHRLCIHSHVRFRLANSSPSSSQLPHAVGTAAKVWTHWAPLDLGPSELSEHQWTSTWDRPSSVSTAGPQPGTLRAQWAPMDLNLGPSELSEHRWTSTAR